MAVEVKEIITHLFDKEVEFESLEKFKDELNKKFVSREIAADDEEIKNKVTGKVLGTIETKLKREFGLTEQEVSGKKVSELVELAGQKNKAKIEELEAKIKTGKSEGDDEKVKKLQEDLTLAKKAAQDYEVLAKENERKLEEAKTEYAQKEQTMEVRFKLDQLKATMQWAESANQFARKGWENHISENYTFVMNDGKLAVTDKQGNHIKNEKGTGYLSPNELLAMEAEKAGLLKKAAGQAGGERQEYKPREGKEGDVKRVVAPNYRRKV